MKVRADAPSLRDARFVRELERSFARACDRGDFRLVHYSIRAKSLQLIVEAQDTDAMGRGMGALGARLGRAMNRVFDLRGKALEDRYRHVVLKTPAEARNALRTVLLGGVRNAGATGIDPASSGRWFDGWRHPAKELIARARARPGGDIRAVAAPHTWLLREGWRTAGPLLDPTEAPDVS